MRQAARPFLTEEARIVYWTEAWESAIVHAARRVASNRRLFYGLRLTALTSTITVPSLVGIDLSDTVTDKVIWLTFILSLVAALSTMITTLFRFGDRWLMFRNLSNELMSAGWALVNSSASDSAKAWAKFTAATNAARSDYNTTYETAVILAAPPSAGGSQRQIDMAAERVEEAVHTALIPPPLVSFSGAIGVSLTNARLADDADGRRVWRVHRNRECQLTVLVETGLGPLSNGPAALSDTPGLQAWEPLEIRGGRSADSVEMDVVVDAPLLEVASAREHFECATTDGFAAYESVIRATEVGHYDLHVALLSAGRVIQAIPVEIVVTGDQ
jgi:hypothetical protein